jgi:hypothetical protein
MSAEASAEECVEVEVVGPQRHHAVVVRALEEAGLSCRWAQPLDRRGGYDHDLTLVILATGESEVAAQVVGQLQLMHPKLRVRLDGTC